MITSEEHSVTIDEEYLNTSSGSGSLIGRVMTERGGGGLPKRLTLLFKQPTLTWLQNNGGQQLYVIPSHAVGCLIEDVMRLVAKGVEVRTRAITEDPK